jgi:hypothetical protein
MHAFEGFFRTSLEPRRFRFAENIVRTLPAQKPLQTAGPQTIEPTRQKIGPFSRPETDVFGQNEWDRVLLRGLQALRAGLTFSSRVTRAARSKQTHMAANAVPKSTFCPISSHNRGQAVPGSTPGRGLAQFVGSLQCPPYLRYGGLRGNRQPGVGHEGDGSQRCPHCDALSASGARFVARSHRSAKSTSQFTSQ